MVRCAVYGCNNHNKKTKKPSNASPQSKVSFYRFPKDPAVCGEWVKFCRRSDKFNVAQSRICSAHFSKSDKLVSLQARLLDYSPKCVRKVNAHAVPSLNGPKQHNEKTARDLKMEERQKREEQKNLVRKALFSPPVVELDVQEPLDLDSPEESLECVPMTEDSPNDMDTSMSVVELYKAKLLLLEEENKALKAQLSNSVKEKEAGDHWAETILKTLFTSNQIQKLKSKGKVNWTADDIVQAITLNRISTCGMF
ncbi:hypothetical protein WDU94_010463 [Cyamophila willieti]